MSSIQEDIALAGNPHCTASDSHGVHDADVKLAALGKADPLGAALWRAKYRGDPRAKRQAEALIANRIATDSRWSLQVAHKSRVMRRRSDPAADIPRPLIERVAFRVLCEWLNDRCTACHGRGTVGQWGAVVHCKRCGGSRREPVQHVERARDLGVTREQYHKHWEPLFDKLLTQIDALDNRVVGVLLGQLKVDTVRPNAEEQPLAA